MEELRRDSKLVVKEEFDGYLEEIIKSSGTNGKAILQMVEVLQYMKRNIPALDYIGYERQFTTVMKQYINGGRNWFGD